MQRTLMAAVFVLVVYSIAVTHRLGVLEGKYTAYEGISDQVAKGNLELKD